jgi:hypothetical protein
MARDLPLLAARVQRPQAHRLCARGHDFSAREETLHEAETIPPYRGDAGRYRALVATALWAGGYESHEKLGLPKDVDPIHETYLPVVQESDFQTAMQKDVAQKSHMMDR